jgi:hypothetical protein
MLDDALGTADRVRIVLSCFQRSIAFVGHGNSRRARRLAVSRSPDSPFRHFADTPLPHAPPGARRYADTPIRRATKSADN